jgi:hypothetical protein
VRLLGTTRLLGREHEPRPAALEEAKPGRCREEELQADDVAVEGDRALDICHRHRDLGDSRHREAHALSSATDRTSYSRTVGALQAMKAAASMVAMPPDATETVATDRRRREQRRDQPGLQLAELRPAHEEDHVHRRHASRASRRA